MLKSSRYALCVIECIQESPTTILWKLTRPAPLPGTVGRRWGEIGEVSTLMCTMAGTSSRELGSSWRRRAGCTWRAKLWSDQCNTLTALRGWQQSEVLRRHSRWPTAWAEVTNIMKKYFDKYWQILCPCLSSSPVLTTSKPGQLGTRVQRPDGEETTRPSWSWVLGWEETFYMKEDQPEPARWENWCPYGERCRTGPCV